MTLNRVALALTIALASTSIAAVPAMAKDQKDQKAPAAAERKYDISAGARKPIGDLQTAINAKDTANIPAKLAAAQAAAKTTDDKYVVAKLHLQTVIGSNNDAAIISALEEIAASGGADPAELEKVYLNAAQISYNSKDFARASTNLSQALKLDPNNVEANVLMAETLNSAGRTGEAVVLIRKAIAMKAASGQKADETWYRRAVGFANQANLPVVNDAALDWVKAYPSPKNWRDTLRIYLSSNNIDPTAGLDVSRLMYTANAMASEADYFRLASPLLAKGFPGEAKIVLDKGIASGAITKQSATIGALYSSAAAKSVGDQASLAGAAKTALAGPSAAKVVVIGDAYAGYGDYAKAIDLYKSALAKTGADKDLTNLHLGMALAKSSDKAGAMAALSTVGGAQAGVAKLWLAYVSTVG